MSGPRFSKVSAALWRSKRFRNLPTDQARLAYLFYLTSEHATSAGTYRLPDAYACGDLGWDVSTLQKARKALVDAGLLVVDKDTEEVYILRWFQHCPPMNDKHSHGIRRVIEAIESDAIRERAEADYSEAEARRNAVPAAPHPAAGITGADRWPVRIGAARGR